MEEEISDRALFALINKMFNAKTLLGKELLSLSEGVPQGNILSPLLSNIYFAKLDEEIERLIEKYNKGSAPTRNVEYYKAIYIKSEERKGKTDAQISNLRQRKILLARKNGLYPTEHDNKYCRVTYVRYADDFIIGVRGTKEVALSIMEEIKNLLKSALHLTVNEEKTQLTHVYSDIAHFLGMRINNVPTSQIPFRRAAHIERFRRLKKSSTKNKTRGNQTYESTPERDNKQHT
jgi:retron-type reverse transcriptase